MKAIGLGITLVGALALKPVVGQNLVFNGDFEYDRAHGNAFPPFTANGLNYKVATGWSWNPYPGRFSACAYEGLGSGIDGSDCQRLRLLQNTWGLSVLWQVIDTAPGTKYRLTGYWTIGRAGQFCNAGECRNNRLLPWIGVFFFDGGAGDFQTDWNTIASFVPTWKDTRSGLILHQGNMGLKSPYRMDSADPPPYKDTRGPVYPVPNNHQIVAEHCYNYPLAFDGYQLDYWESFYDAAGVPATPRVA